MTRVLYLLVVFSAITKVQAQSKISISFLQHLEQIGEFREGLLYINEKEKSETSDSISFFKGKFNYELKNIESSIKAFSEISDQNYLLVPYARFYQGLQSSYLGRYQEANDFFLLPSKMSQEKEELRKLELAGVHLLNRDLQTFDSLSALFEPNYFQLAAHQNGLKEARITIGSYRYKSPYLAGVLSAVVPGSGKFYQGEVGEGSMALVTTGLFFLQAYEAYRKDGFNSARFYVFGSALAVFYTANIWGSVVSVRIQRERFNKQMNETILLNMHVPLRAFFH